MRIDDLRDRAEPAEYLGRVERSHAQLPHDYTQGVLAALRWTLGEQGADAPITKVPYPPDLPAYNQVVREERAARDVVYGRTPHRPTPAQRAIASGVEATLMWVRGDASREPW